MKEWYTLAEIQAANLPDLPPKKSALYDHAQREGWTREGCCRRRAAKGGGLEYHISLLPGAAQTRLLMIHNAAANDDRDYATEARAALWDRYHALPQSHKEIAKGRLKALDEVIHLTFNGYSMQAAAALVAKKIDVSARTIFYWQETCAPHKREDWEAALAPAYSSDRAFADCHPNIWDTLRSDYLRPEKPSFSTCYRRVAKAAKEHGWEPLPSERALRRRLDAEVSKAVQTLARSGKDKAKALYPAQRRTRTHLHAMQMVNMDGHKLDVFVRVPWAAQPVRLYLIGIQDLYSGKLLSWRLTEAETWEAVRLVIGDMVEAYGIPEDIYLDNGRAFASKWITGQTRTRFRFKIREEDPRGLLTTLGVKVHWTTPYAGQSKPIERAWRDLAENISKHPAVAGAYVGNKPDAKPENYGSRAIPFDEFRAHVAVQIAEHNSQEGRRSSSCNGRSFDETFRASMENPSTVVRVPSASQSALWLLASEVLTARKPDGAIHFQGNRYWDAALNQHVGKKVTIRFDPDRLHDPIKVYDLDNRLICTAACLDDTGFDDVDAARLHARTRKDYLKGVNAQRAAQAALSAQQLADIFARGQAATPSAPEPVRPAVTRIFTGAAAPKIEVHQDQFEDNFARAMRLVSGGDADVLQFPKKGE
jgi:transposase InsO family protein